MDLDCLNHFRGHDAERTAILAGLRRATAADLAVLEAQQVPSLVRDAQAAVLRRTIDRIDHDTEED